MSRPKRVCHIAQTAYTVDPRVRKQVEALAEAGYEVDVLCLQEETPRPASTPDSVRFYYAPIAQRRGGIWRYLFEYVAFFLYACLVMIRESRKRYELIHVSNMPDILVFATWLPRLLGSRIILDIHDPTPELFVSKFGIVPESLLFKLLRWEERLSMRYAHHVITVTDAVAECIRPLAPKKEITVIMNLPDFSSTSRHPQHAIPADGQRPFRLIYTGTVAPRYDVRTIVESLVEVRHRIPNIQLVIVGGGDGLLAIKDAVVSLGLESHVQFSGWVPSSSIPGIVEGCDIGIASGQRDDYTDMGLPTKVFDYLALGTPTIAYRTSALERFVPDGTIRFYESRGVDSLAQAVLDLYEHPELRAEMSRKGIEFSRTANWSTEKQKYISLIEKLASRK